MAAVRLGLGEIGTLEAPAGTATWKLPVVVDERISRLFSDWVSSV